MALQDTSDCGAFAGLIHLYRASSRRILFIAETKA